MDLERWKMTKKEEIFDEIRSLAFNFASRNDGVMFRTEFYEAYIKFMQETYFEMHGEYPASYSPARPVTGQH
jgi:argininosuccinate synthase